MKNWRWMWWLGAPTLHALLLAALTLWAALECFGRVPSQSIAAATYDLMQGHRLWASPPDPRILIVDIDERSLADLSEEFGRWPWSRDTLATVLQYAQSEGARALLFDTLFSDPDRLRPGGDHALDAAVQASPIAYFEVVRLPHKSDRLSDLTLDRVPGLGVRAAGATAASASAPGPRIALILPFMKSMVDAGRIGTNTVQLEPDGKLRRFSWVEPLDGWSVLSVPMAMAHALGVPIDTSGEHRLMVWRQGVDAYPRVSFSEVMACAEQPSRTGCVPLRDKILIVGATAPSLHDLMSSPLAANHSGVDILATLVDNAIHERWYREPNDFIRFGLAIGALALAWRASRRRAAGATQVALLVLPIGLVLIGFASLHSEWLYLDLMLPAGVALTYLSVIKLYDTLRRNVFGQAVAPEAGRFALATGSEGSCAEQLERRVFDLAGRRGLTVSGGVNTSGGWGTGASCWVMWNLDQDTALALGELVREAIPAAWTVPFQVGSDPDRDLHVALSRPRDTATSIVRDVRGAVHETA